MESYRRASLVFNILVILSSVSSDKTCILHSNSFESQFCELKSEVEAMGLKYADVTQAQTDIVHLKHAVQSQTAKIVDNEKAIASQHHSDNVTDDVEKLKQIVADLLNRTAEVEAKGTGPVSPCGSNPCRHNASCLIMADGYYCVCSGNFTGQHCEMEDHCAMSPCENGGTCYSNAFAFMCNCTSGYGGPTCETKLTPCDSNPCVNGLCTPKNETYSCFCDHGFSGITCNVSATSPMVTSPGLSTSGIMTTVSTTTTTPPPSVCDIGQPKCNPPAKCVPIPGSNDFRCECPETAKTQNDTCLVPQYVEPFGFCCMKSTCSPNADPICI